MTDYTLLCEQLRALGGEERHWLPLRCFMRRCRS